jgi:hypothetical protein
MKRYFIESSHTGEDCLRVLKDFLSAGYLTHFEWGCEAGHHYGWAMIEAENEAEARMAVPSLLRGKARVIELNRFTKADLEKEVSLHKKP